MDKATMTVVAGVNLVLDAPAPTEYTVVNPAMLSLDNHDNFKTSGAKDELNFFVPNSGVRFGVPSVSRSALYSAT